MKGLIICLTIILVFSFAFSILKPLDELYRSSDEIPFSGGEYLHVLTEKDLITLSSFNLLKNEEGMLELKLDPNVSIKEIKEHIIDMKMSHNSADTIKRILLAHLNNIELVLNDNDSDNNDLICKNIIPQLVSDLALYEKINILKSIQANKIHQDVEILESSLCSL